MYEYLATVLKVVDGDTIDLDVDLGLYTHAHERVRLYGIDAWETRGEHKEKGKLAREELRKLLAQHDRLRIRSVKDKRGKYGRFLAIVHVDPPLNVVERVGTPPGLLGTVNEWLVEQGHAIWKSY